MRRNEDRLPVRREERGSMIPWTENDWLTPETMFGASPWQMMRRMQDDMDRMFGQLFSSGSAAGISPAAAGGWSPSMDISESDKEWCIEADLPGVDRENVEVQVQNQSLILRAELRPPVEEQRREEAGRRYHRQERRYGYFERVLPLPENVKEDAINCEFRNGVLSVHIPKTEQTQQSSRRIPVQEGAPSKAPAATAASRSDQQAQAGTGGGRSTKQPAVSASKSEHALHEDEEEVRETAGRR